MATVVLVITQSNTQKEPRFFVDCLKACTTLNSCVYQLVFIISLIISKIDTKSMVEVVLVAADRPGGILALIENYPKKHPW